MTMDARRIGLSFYGGGAEYDIYEAALRARALEAGIEIAPVWLAGADRPFLSYAVRRLDWIMFTGGPDVGTAPERDGIERALLEHALHERLPVLAICRGAQLLNVCCGGTLVSDLGTSNVLHRAPREMMHAVELEQPSRVAGIAGGTHAAVNSSHHQAVERLADGFRVTATAPDGVIEAFEPGEVASRPFLLAVQWHPETMPARKPLGEGILDAFLAACER